MPTYAIGDIQGCFRTFERLLDTIRFEPDRDRLWLVGDVVNRGPHSLETLRWVVEHDDCVTCVLGNHDMHLLARYAGLRKPKARDTVGDVLEADDADELIEWVRRRPLLFRDGDHLLVHAGVLPAWSADEALERAREVELLLAGSDWVGHLGDIYARGTIEYNDALEGADRTAAIAAVFAQMRLCTLDGRPVYGFSGAPGDAPAGQLPWFEVPGRKTADHTVVFGHWAALGRHVVPGAIALDSGCVWGGELTAVRLSDGRVFFEPNAEDE